MKSKGDDLVKAILTPFSSFPRKRESSKINHFWDPTCAGATAFLTFYKFIKRSIKKKGEPN
jgi:hypothetical protein